METDWVEGVLLPRYTEVLVDAVDLGPELVGVAGADVGFENQTGPGRPDTGGFDGTPHHVHHLIPLPLDEGEHGVEFVGQAGFCDDSHRLGDGGADAVGFTAGGSDTECHDHLLSLPYPVWTPQPYG